MYIYIYKSGACICERVRVRAYVRACVCVYVSVGSSGYQHPMMGLEDHMNIHIRQMKNHKFHSLFFYRSMRSKKR